MDKKRKRNVLSIQQKLQIIEQFEKGKTVKSLKDEYGVGDQTVRDLIKKKNDILKFACSSDSSSGMKKTQNNEKIYV
jgi:transposase-like protein